MSDESKERFDNDSFVEQPSLEGRYPGTLSTQVLTTIRDAVHQCINVPGDVEHESLLRNLFLIEFVQNHLNTTQPLSLLNNQKLLKEKVKEYIFSHKQYAYAFEPLSEHPPQAITQESNPLRIAQQAIIWVQNFIKEGDNFLSNNGKSAEDFSALVMRVDKARREMSQFDSALTASLYTLIEDTLKRSLEMPEKYAVATLIYTGAAIAAKKGLGNCSEMAHLVLDYIAQHYPSLRAEYACIEPGDHGFVIMGRPLKSDPNDISTWGSAIVCDAWSGRAYPISEVSNFLCDFKWNKNRNNQADHKLIKFNSETQKIGLPSYSNVQTLYELRNTMSLIKKDYPEIYAQAQPENWVSCPYEQIQNFIEKTLSDNPKYLLDWLKTEPTLTESINIKGETLLHLAVKNGHADILEAVLKINPRLINIQDNTGCTALHLASQKADAELMSLLIKAKADTTLLDKNGNTAHQLIATKPNKTQLIQVLKNHSLEDVKPIKRWQDKFKLSKSSELIKQQISSFRAEAEQLKSTTCQQRFSAEKQHTSYSKLTALPLQRFVHQGLLEQLRKKYNKKLKKLAKTTDTMEQAQAKLDLKIGHKNVISFVQDLTEIAKLLQRDGDYIKKNLPELAKHWSIVVTDFVTSVNKSMTSGLLSKRPDQHNAINIALDDFNLAFAKLSQKPLMAIADEKMNHSRPLMHDVTKADQHEIKLKTPATGPIIFDQKPGKNSQKYSIAALIVKHSAITHFEKNKPSKSNQNQNQNQTQNASSNVTLLNPEI